MKKINIIILLLTLSLGLPAQSLRMNVTQFCAVPDGVTLNTNSIQAGIDYLHEHGGGTLVFPMGRYLTGGITLKSNVSLYLEKSATLVGSKNPYDYDNVGWSAIVTANNASHIGIYGEGTIEGGGRDLVYNIVAQAHAGIVNDPLQWGRPGRRPQLITFYRCTNAEVKGITLCNSAFWVQTYSECQYVTIDGINVDCNTFWNNDGLDMWCSQNIKVLNSVINSTDDGICFKAGKTGNCENIEIRNCIVRSSANGFKFGSEGFSDYRNIKIINCKVYDTFRSALNFSTIDGGAVENIYVENMLAENVGNAIFIRLEKRFQPDIVGRVNNVVIRNSSFQVAAEKLDKGYPYEGPVEDNPRNISPCAIAGLPDRIIENVTLQNVKIVHPGGGDPFYAKVSTSSADLDAIPEKPEMYPDFSKLMELPAWGFFIRHAKNITFDNVTLTAQKKDYRPSIVMIDVKDSSFKDMTFEEPDSDKKEQAFQYKTNNIKVELKK